jgi:SAM-dependent methyltransferase
VLHHTGHPNKVLGEAFRVLREGGRAGFTVWADPSKLEAFGLFFSVVEEHVGTVEFPHGPLFGVSDFDDFHSMVREAGFCDSAVRELPIQWRTQSLDSYLAGFCDWANLDSLPGPSRDRIEATVRERAEAYRSGDAFVMPNPAILVSGVKS